MKKYIVKIPHSSQEEYPIFIGSGLIGNIATLINIKKYSKVFIITDQIIKKIFLKKIMVSLPNNTGLISFAFSEKEKNIENVQKIWRALASNQCDRKSLVVNLGGGVIGDMGGFAASTFMRGVDFVNIPTTLLSQVDASVGGKTGIDFYGIKNLIGTFDQPIAVIIDTETLTTLPKREFLSGFGEIIKHGLVVDKNHFENVTAKHPLKFSQDEISAIIFQSIKIKISVIEKDETEVGIRKILNFGHTIGHAVESLSLDTSKPLLHGEAVSIGMIAEAKISHALKLLSSNDLECIKQALINAGLPTSLPVLEKSRIIKKMNLDKKNEKGKTNFTLLAGIGKAVINKQVPADIVREVL